MCERILAGGREKSFRSHIAWSKRRNVNLKELTTSRCLKSTVIVALMVKANTGILFSNSDVAIRIRDSLKEGDYSTFRYWIGITSCFSVRGRVQ